MNKAFDVDNSHEHLALMNEDIVEYGVIFFAALANRARLRIVEVLVPGEMTVGDIANGLSLSQPSTSRHLAVLVHAGVLTVAPKGVARYYRLRGPRIAAIIRLLSEFRQIHREAIEAEYVKLVDAHDQHFS